MTQRNMTETLLRVVILSEAKDLLFAAKLLILRWDRDDKILETLCSEPLCDD